ncbi:unnamed protein product [Enterobius vermicularis]|uniref:Transcription factor bHLH130-like n=1 Tax=Enterobius vermicularis TaxID=51028 RepID=A0A0N4VL63_ENTVE|nr:unnamed protein product [Enterobius vermicularis]
MGRQVSLSSASSSSVSEAFVLKNKVHFGKLCLIKFRVSWLKKVLTVLRLFFWEKGNRSNRTIRDRFLGRGPLVTRPRKVAAIEGTGDAACVLVQKIEEHCLQFVGQLRKLTTSLNIAGTQIDPGFETNNTTTDYFTKLSGTHCFCAAVGGGNSSNDATSSTADQIFPSVPDVIRKRTSPSSCNFLNLSNDSKMPYKLSPNFCFTGSHEMGTAAMKNTRTDPNLLRGKKGNPYMMELWSRKSGSGYRTSQDESANLVTNYPWSRLTLGLNHKDYSPNTSLPLLAERFAETRRASSENRSPTFAKGFRTPNTTEL